MKGLTTKVMLGAALACACGNATDEETVEDTSDALSSSRGGDEPASGPGAGGYEARTFEPSLLRYFVIPHADDEIESWALVEHDTTHYPVFILATRGEQTRYCDGSGFDPGTGERAPKPASFSTAPNNGRFSKHCTDQRVDAWGYFLDEMGKNKRSNIGAVRYIGEFTGQVRQGDPVPQRCDSTSSRTENCRVSAKFEVWAGPHSARVVFDLGDGDLTKEEVVWAVRTVQRHKHLFAVQREDDIVAAGYANGNPLFGLPYLHGDHKAIHEALFHTDLGLPGPQWGRTSFGDPDAVLNLNVSPALYNDVFRVEGDKRVGPHTVAYGWLADPYYRGCEKGYTCVFSRNQKFWRRF